jgi:hypothetical protein
LGEGFPPVHVRRSDSLHYMANLCIWARQDQIGHIPGSDFSRGFYESVRGLSSFPLVQGHILKIPQRIDGSCDIVLKRRN